ncbi:MAG: GNAT family N-acetyltransferase [Chloroflexi bacterium]|nr:GNAT family N-acetyltransferase [Chloroflexota bacterium]
MSTGEVTIRDCRREDVASVLALWAASPAAPTPTDTPEDLERAVSEPGLEFLVAESNGEITGTIIGGFDGWRGSIYRLTVAEQYQRQGIGRALLEEVKARFALNGVKVVGAYVRKDHPWALDYWDSVGFKLDERFVIFMHRM